MEEINIAKICKSDSLSDFLYSSQRSESRQAITESNQFPGLNK